MRLIAAPFATLALAALSAQARADLTKDQCVDANGKGQDLRHDGKFSAARTEFQTCAGPSCPAIVRDDCTRRLDELERAQPSLLCDVKDAKGADIIEVRVTIDGQLLAERLDGHPLRVDPGVHELGFEMAGHAPVTRKVLMREGESGRHERVVMGDEGGPPPPLPRALPPNQVAPSGGGGLGTQKVAGLVIAAGGVVGIGLGATFGLLASSAWGKAQSVCGGNAGACIDVVDGKSNHDTAVLDGTIATVGFIAGGALLATGLVLFFTGRSAEGRAAATAPVALFPGVGPGQGGLVLRGAF